VKRIDLHAHTLHSDGTLTPRELVERARDQGLAALAVTDHDTTSGLAEARAAGAEFGVEIFDGCEITAHLPAGTAHILAYAFDEDDADFQALLARVRECRHERNHKILAKLADLHAPLEYEEVVALSHGTIVARPHIAQALVNRDYVADQREAFQRFLRDGGPAYARANAPPADEVIRTTTAAGGVTVLAHPRTLKLENRRGFEHVIGGLAKAGLAGLEVDHPSHDTNRRALFSDIAVALDLVPSAGSDFHGANKPYLELGVGDGTIEVHYDTWERLMARRPAEGVA